MRAAVRRMIEGGAGAVEVACAACVSLAAARAMIARVRPVVDEMDYGSPAGGAVAMEREPVAIEAGTTEPTAAAPLGGGPVDGSRGAILPPEKPRARPRSSGDDTSGPPAGGMAVSPGAVRRATAAEAGNPGPTAVSSQNGGALVDGPCGMRRRSGSSPARPPLSRSRRGKPVPTDEERRLYAEAVAAGRVNKLPDGWARGISWIEGVCGVCAPPPLTEKQQQAVARAAASRLRGMERERFDRSAAKASA